ncbi:hypothetical protein QFZ53_002714 [Microbacterium natoriense]|uniref:Uncharacterized protein n=1 Tax=Microbacterium natoriense TaxID=284570 RepID=A0AAW8EZ56_9MICO|nr:hypothetical protein [Microbacterium natoriense]MDQ0648518.1 hypothetical protein [Microbacterium natoriense]
MNDGADIDFDLASCCQVHLVFRFATEPVVEYRCHALMAAPYEGLHRCIGLYFFDIDPYGRRCGCGYSETGRVCH